MLGSKLYDSVAGRSQKSWRGVLVESVTSRSEAGILEAFIHGNVHAAHTRLCQSGCHPQKHLQSTVHGNLFHKRL